MTLNACVALPNGTFRTVVDTRALATCVPDRYIADLARSSCNVLASVANDDVLAPFAIEAYTLGGKKTQDASIELYARMSQEVEDQWGVDTSNWNRSVGVLQCRSAPYHNDPFNPEVAYINWYVEGPPATFELNGKSTHLETGSIIVFDPYCPHALYYGKEYDFNATTTAKNYATSLFVTLEVPMSDVAYLLGVKKLLFEKALLMNEYGGVDPMSGKWVRDRQYLSESICKETPDRLCI